MKAYLIDPHTKTVTELDVDYTDDREGLEAIYSAIGARTIDVVTVSPEGDMFFVDDEGFMRADNPCFEWTTSAASYAGKALFMGCNAYGATTAPIMSIDWVREHVVFSGHLSTGDFGPTTSHQGEHGFVINVGAPILKEGE